MIDEQPLITPYKDAWVLSTTARRVVLSSAADRSVLRRQRVLWYAGPDTTDNGAVVSGWLTAHDRITSGDYAALTGLTTAGARRTLDRLVEDDLLMRGEAAGRNALPADSVNAYPFSVSVFWFTPS